MSSSYVPAETESPNFYFQSVFILHTWNISYDSQESSWAHTSQQLLP